MTTLRGTWTLFRLALRRDLLAVLAWTALFCTLLAVMTESFRDTYPDSMALAGYSAAIDASPMQHFFNGPGAALDTYGGMMVFEIGGYLVVVVALLSLLTVVRHSRAEEANGDAELIRAGSVGRHALNASAAILAIGSALWWGLVCAITLGVLGLGWRGALTYGLCVASAGALFAAIAAVTSQVCELPRTATALAGAILAISFVLRGFGDLRDHAIRWISPLGWAQSLRPFGTERLWPMLLVVTFVVAGFAMAAVLNNRRDLDSGWWSPRPGPIAAHPGLRRLGGLIGSLQRPAVRGWWLAVGGLGLAFGLVSEEFTSAGDQVDLSSFVGETADPEAALIEFSALLLAILASAASVALVTIAASEENTGRLEVTLAGAVSRSRWFGWQLGGALVGAAVVLLVGAIGFAAGLAVSGADSVIFDPVLAVLAHLPAVWVITALAIALCGASVRLLPLAWIPLAYAVVVGLFGPALRLPNWTMNASPFTHVPQVPAESIVNTAQFVLVGLTLVLICGGVRGFLSRDIRG